MGTLWGRVAATTGTTTVQPTHVVTVDLIAGTRVVARRSLVGGAAFRFRAAAGRYTLQVEGVPGCRGGASVDAHRSTAALVVCPLFRALGSVAFATLPMSGPITTRPDALKRAAPGAIEHGSTRVDAVETNLGSYVTFSGTGPSGVVLPAHETPTMPVWVVCQGGGTYANFNGTRGYKSTCSVYGATTGSPLGNTQSKDLWPTRWFTRLPLLPASEGVNPVTTAFTSITTRGAGWSVTLTVKRTTVKAGHPVPAMLVITNDTGRAATFDSCASNGVFGMTLESRTTPNGNVTGAVACSTPLRPGRNVFPRTIATTATACGGDSSPPCPAPLPAGTYSTAINWPRFSTPVPKPGKLAIRLTR